MANDTLKIVELKTDWHGVFEEASTMIDEDTDDGMLLLHVLNILAKDPRLYAVGLYRAIDFVYGGKVVMRVVGSSTSKDDRCAVVAIDDFFEDAEYRLYPNGCMSCSIQ